jgi:hypothetical protein
MTVLYLWNIKTLLKNHFNLILIYYVKIKLGCDNNENIDC